MNFTYWEGQCPAYITLCHETLARHNPDFVVLSKNDVDQADFMQDLVNDEFYWRLMPAHRADLIRIRYLEQFGGFWIDSDFIALNSFDVIAEASQRHHAMYYYRDDWQPTNGILFAPPKHSAIVEWSWKNTAVFANLKRMDALPTPHDRWCSFGADQLKVVLATAIDKCQDLTRERVQPIAYHSMERYWSTDDLRGNAWPACYGYMLFNTGFPQWFKGLSREEILSGPWLISYLFRLGLGLEQHKC